jgi:hypothetical protein
VALAHCESPLRNTCTAIGFTIQPHPLFRMSKASTLKGTKMTFPNVTADIKEFIFFYVSMEIVFPIIFSTINYDNWLSCFLITQHLKKDIQPPGNSS